MTRSLRFASLAATSLLLAHCALTLEPRFYKEASAPSDDARATDSDSPDGAAVVDGEAPDAPVIVEDAVTSNDGAVIDDVIASSDAPNPTMDARSDSGFSTADGTGPRDSSSSMDTGVVTDSGAMDSGVVTDSGGAVDTGLPVDVRTDTGIPVDARSDGSGPLPCAMGETMCSARCVDTSRDETNCGSCGSVCAFGQICTGGLCRICSMAALCMDSLGDRCCLPSCPPAGTPFACPVL